MADNPVAGAGGVADGAAKSKAASTADSGSATVGKASDQGASSAASQAQTPAGAGALPGAQQGGVPGLSANPSPLPPGAGTPAPPPALGAGGTSAAPKAPGEGDGVVPGEGKGGAVKVAGAAAAVPAAGAAGQMIVLMTFINWLKGLLMQAAALAMNLFNMFMAAILAGVKAVVGFFMGIGTAVSSAVGGLVSAAVAGTASFFAGLLTVAVVITGAVVGVTATNEAAQRDGMVSCVVPAQAALAEVEGQEGNADQITLANAKTIFSVLKAWGMPDENIAGILGNWQMESGIDPTSVEGIHDEKFTMGPKKKAAEEANFGGFVNSLGNEMEVRGLGLGQWTNGRGQKLVDYAAAIGQPWHKLETQLGFMIGADNPGSVDIIKDMLANSKGTPGEASLHFHHVWEVSDDGQDGLDRRAAAANDWMGKFSGWTANKSLADSILAQAGTTLTNANSDRAETIRSECRGTNAGSFSLKDGGLTLEEAQELMAIYLAEGEDFLQARYPNGAGGPGVCAGGISDNCVGFSTYFVNKYTSFQQYARGNGIDTASSMASMMGKETTQVPTAYSVASGPGSGAEGHTFVVLGIEGDQAVIGEAACGTYHRGTQARYMPISTLTNGSWEFVDVTDLMTAEPAS